MLRLKPLYARNFVDFYQAQALDGTNILHRTFVVRATLVRLRDDSESLSANILLSFVVQGDRSRIYTPVLFSTRRIT